MQVFKMDISERQITPTSGALSGSLNGGRLWAMQGDVGRKFALELTDNGENWTMPADGVLSVWYCGGAGEGNYTCIGEKSAFAVEGNTIVVELIAQMTQSPGGGMLCVLLNDGQGNQLGLVSLPYTVTPVPGIDGPQAESYYGAFAQEVALLQNLVASKLPAYESANYPGCYYYIRNGKNEWINPPMLPGTEYATTQRYQGNLVYVKLYNMGALPTQGKYITTAVAPDGASIIGFEGYATSSAGTVAQMPFFDSEGDLVAKINVSEGNRLTVWSFATVSDYTLFVCVRYIK